MWNEERTVARTLDSLLAQEFDGELEIVVADADSTDRSLEIVRERQQRAGHIVLARNPSRNTAVGRNICLRRCRGEIAVNFNAHAVAPEGFLKTLVRKLRQAPEDVAAVGAGNVAPGEESLSGRIIAVVNASLLGAGKGDAFANYSREQEVPSIAFAAYRTEVLERVGGFDETLWVGQDYELNYRLREAGYKIIFTPDTVVYRFNRSSLGKYWRQMFRYGIARSLILRKHPDSLRWLYLVPGLFSIYVVLGLLSSLAVPALLPWYGGSLALYAACCWLSSLLLSRDPRLVALSPIFYFTVHFGYGTGLLRGAFGKQVW